MTILETTQVEAIRYVIKMAASIHKEMDKEGELIIRNKKEDKKLIII